MIEPDFLQGNQSQWRFCELLGEGDAGEVYLVESLRERKPAVLKRPKRSSFTSEIVRQASQIDTEARILRALAKSRLVEDGATTRIARLLDQSIPGNELTERYFIVIEKVPGFHLGILEKLFRFDFQKSTLIGESLDGASRLYLTKVSEYRSVPELLILRVLTGLLDLFDTVHKQHGQSLQGEYHGILWNDVKLDHLFWDPENSGLTVIDWGNGQFLEADSVTADRLYSPVDDYRQFLEAMGRFLSSCAPNLHAALHWPKPVSPADTSPKGLYALKERIANLTIQHGKNLREARLREVAVVSSATPDPTLLKGLEDIQRRIIQHGEIPDYAAAARAYARQATNLVDEGKWDEFLKICECMVGLPGADHQRWNTLSLITTHGLECSNPPPELYQQAIRSGIEDRWADVLWDLCDVTKEDPGPERWQELSAVVRRMVEEINQPLPTPYKAANRLLETLEADRPRIIERLSQAIAIGNLPDPENPERLIRFYDVITAKIKNDILKKWTQLDPLPPDGDLSYTDIDTTLGELNQLLPRLGVEANLFTGELQACLAQPRAQISIILDSWQAKGFKTASQGLRNLLLWDPDRRRVLQVDHAVAEAVAVLDEARQGPGRGERLQDYAIRMEFHCRELRSRVAATYWLDIALGLFTNLRNGKRPGDLLSENPKIADSFTWLQRYERKHQPEKQVSETVRSSRSTHRHIAGLEEGKECRFGPSQDLVLAEPLDAWVPEARGSSARVFQGFARGQAGQLRQLAVKVMRADKVDYASPLFFEEVLVLSRLDDIPGVARLLECGFMRLEKGQSFPDENSQLAASSLTGSVIRYEGTSSQTFLSEYQDKIEAGWLPYLALDKKSNDDNLLFLCDEGYTRGKYLPVETGLRIAVKICDILEIAHARDIVYRDHKILHYYWNNRLHKVSMIDWNVARWHRDGLDELDVKLDLVQFGARTLHHILTGRPAPGALPVGPNQPFEIEMAPQQYAVTWTYDDSQRIPDAVMELLGRLLTGEYDQIQRLREDLLMHIPFRKE